MPDDTQAVAEAPEQAEEAPAESTEPTPVREGMPSTEREARDAALEKGMAAIRERAEAAEAPAEAEETDAEAEAPEETSEARETPEVSAEDAVTMDAGPDQAELPEGWTYDEGGRLHDDDGQFRSADQLQAALAPETEDEPAASGEEDSPTSEDPDAVDVPEGFERVELPEGHPLRDRGETHLAIPSEEAVGESTHQYYRHLINAGAENRQLKQQFTQLQNRLARMEAEREVSESGAGSEWDPRQNEELAQQIADHRDAYGDESAERLIEALKAKHQQEVRERTDEALSQRQQQQQATQFAAQVVQAANPRYDIWPGHVDIVPVQDPETGQATYRLSGHGERYQQVAQAMSRYGKFVEMHGTQPSVEEFFEFLDRRYVQDPRVRQSVQEWREQQKQNEREQIESEATEKAKKEAEQAERERLKEAAEKRDANPMGKVGGTSTGKSTPRPEQEPFDATGKSESEIMEGLKERFGLA